MNESRSAWLAWARASGLPIADEAARIGECFGAELEQYCELVSGPGGEPLGFMTRGEDESFTLRAAALMRTWRLPTEGVRRFCEQAAFFEHRRAFLKLEWASNPTEGVQRLAAYYHRRRPAVLTMEQYYRAAGVNAAALLRMRHLASVLGKSSIHFVAAALRPGLPMHHKLYFSQYVTPPAALEVKQRLQAALRLFEIDRGAAAAWLESHDRLLGEASASTLFVSMRFSDQQLLPGLKIDYPEVPRAALLDCVAAPERALLARTAAELCSTARTPRVSFVGVSFGVRGPPRLKLYADLPSPTALKPN